MNEKIERITKELVNKVKEVTTNLGDPVSWITIWGIGYLLSGLMGVTTMFWLLIIAMILTGKTKNPLVKAVPRAMFICLLTYGFVPMLTEALIFVGKFTVEFVGLVVKIGIGCWVVKQVVDFVKKVK